MIELSIIAALFIYMLDYGLGKPGDEKPVYGSLLSAWAFYLAKKALGSLYISLNQQYRDQLSNAKNDLEKMQIKRSFREIVFMQGRQLFTWQKIAGMCPICTHFWFSLILFFLVNIFYFHVNIIIFTLYFLLSHFLIRLLKKWI